MRKHFKSITLENAMKPSEIQPFEGKFYFETCDKMKEFADQNNIKMRGHTFVWHNQTPDWMFVDKNGATVSKELLIDRIREHIKTLCDRYRDVIYSWDVVNEAIEAYASLGLKIEITELDVSMFAFEDERNDLKEPTEEMMELQGGIYNNIFSVFREYKDLIRPVTFWGISDMYTWKDYFPVINRKDWPMLFDIHGQPKPFFNNIISNI
jgi:GH35 family endo-1,4-beta-xylanase